MKVVSAAGRSPRFEDNLQPVTQSNLAFGNGFAEQPSNLVETFRRNISTNF
ncbi:MAG: hypothetical protein AB1589_12385 [Cyanobacteriota bacterium]